MARSPRVSLLMAAACAAIAGVAVNSGASAQNDCDSASSMTRGGAVSLISENDLFGGTDRNYTNGLQLSLVSGPCEKLLGTEFLSQHLLPARFDEGRAWRAGLAVGQMMFTPADISLVDPDPLDRPYAAWLYGSFSLISHTDGADRRIAALDTAKLDVGWVGPGAAGDFVQRNWHELINGADPMGWDNQIRDEPGLNVALETARRSPVAEWGWLDADAEARVGGALGNVATNASAGAAVRLGYNLGNDYGPPRIRPALGGATFFDNQGPWSWYLFAGVEGRAVARDIFLDGNTFRSSPSVDKEPLLFDAQGGAVLRLGNAQVSFTYVHRSESFKGQLGPDRFGAITLSVRR